MGMLMHVKPSRPIRPVKKRMKVKARSTRETSRAESRPAPLRQIPIGAVDWSLAIRPISVDHVERLAAAAQLPPVRVWEVQPGQYRGIDGFHRWRLANERGDKTERERNSRFRSYARHDATLSTASHEAPA